MNPDHIAAAFLGLVALVLAVWSVSGYLRDLNDRAEKKRREHDRIDFLASLAAEQYTEQRRQDEWDAHVRAAFQQAMTEVNGPRVVEQIDRIRRQIAANEAERELRAALADDEALARWLA